MDPILSGSLVCEDAGACTVFVSDVTDSGKSQCWGFSYEELEKAQEEDGGQLLIASPEVKFSGSTTNVLDWCTRSSRRRAQVIRNWLFRRSLKRRLLNSIMSFLHRVTWYHGSCVNVSPTDALDIDKYRCTLCRHNI